MKFSHVPVMLDECIDGLQLKRGGIYFDGTLGGAGHSEAILRGIGDGRLIATDLDEEAIANAKVRLRDFDGRFSLYNDNFKNFERVKQLAEVDEFDGAILDLGVSSYQLDNRERGFSYLSKDAALDMRMDSNAEFSARDVVNGYSREKLVYILETYGEERFAKSIADNICKEREKSPIETTGRLADIIDTSIPFKFKQNGHPAKKTFQAIRVEVNGELDGLADAIKSIVRSLKKGGRIVILTFHSLEDRIVKRTFQDLETDCVCDKRFPVCVCGKKREIKIINKKPIEAGEEELRQNPRSKSAKLRIAERI